MAMRSYWKGSISFGLVNIPVSLYLAAQSERVSFHLLHEKDRGRIHYKKVCELDGEDVPQEEIAKGYEYDKGAYVTIDEEDLESIDIGLRHTIEIVQFVEQDEIDPAFYDKPYFLEPLAGADRAYALLRASLAKSGKVGIARIVFRERESLAAVRPRGETLVLDTLRFASEMRDPDALRLPRGEEAEPSDEQLDLAAMLVDRLSAPWKPERYVDRYDEAVMRMIQRKLEGLPAPERPALPAPGAVADLADLLRESLGREKEERKKTKEARKIKEKRPAKGERAAPKPRQAARKVSSKTK
ncbi:Ku protein [Vulgatibacter incomptus]|uniref:Non-homologous end joining protein Ku n=1 Tax=Vulgatibacter incomptus TaxID=1391653 RepID=A0A0K1PAM2_9BACT|nr:Ku protein [Vulgatibacter incomptus]AKU90552.1 Ku domain protein [Vulgatibacter incomptus]